MNNNSTIRKLSQQRKTSQSTHDQELYSQIESSVAQLSKGSAKVVGVLLWFSTRVQRIKPSQSLIARWTGLTREWVNKLLKRLRAMRIIWYCTYYRKVCMYELTGLLDNSLFKAAVYTTRVMVVKSRLKLISEFARIPAAVGRSYQKFTLLNRELSFSFENWLVGYSLTRRAVHCSESLDQKVNELDGVHTQVAPNPTIFKEKDKIPNERGISQFDLDEMKRKAYPELYKNNNGQVRSNNPVHLQKDNYEQFRPRYTEKQVDTRHNTRHISACFRAYGVGQD